MTDSATPKPRRIRFVPLAWISGVLAAGLLVLGASGTLSSWTAAILNNNTNSVATSNAVVLQETGPDGTAAHTAQTCLSSTNTSNSYTCSTINKYGGTTSPLTPGGSQTATVTFTNIGSTSGSNFTLTPAACGQTPIAGTGTPVNPANLCTSSDLTVAMSCYTGTTATGTAFTDLAYSGTATGFTSATTLAHTTGIAKGASVTCKFTVGLGANASPLDGGITVTQGLTWELDV